MTNLSFNYDYDVGVIIQDRDGVIKKKMLNKVTNVTYKPNVPKASSSLWLIFTLGILYSRIK